MPPDAGDDAGSAQHWLSRARSDLALAGVPVPRQVLLDDLCFHAQQAAEKALKAVYIRHGWSFPYVHDIEELATGLQRHGIDIPAEIEQAVTLTHFAVAARYPGLNEPVEQEEYEQAVSLARAVVSWAEKQVAS